MYRDELPSRVRVLVLGGGIHGVGVLHDLASRGWKDIHLIEKGSIGSGTSSRSTKLIHGGLRYLKRISDFGLVTEALHERKKLQDLAPDLVKPMEFLFPIIKKAGMPQWQVKCGLFLYDGLSGRDNIGKHKYLNAQQLLEQAPFLDGSKISCGYSFWDSQTDDLSLVHRVAASARHLGAGITEQTQGLSIRATDDGWKVTLQDHLGVTREINSLYLVNALGPWANTILDKSGLAPTHKALNNKGSHLIFEDIGLKKGLFLQSLKGDGRIHFLLPWLGKTLLGTTEHHYEGSLDEVRISDEEVHYLLENTNALLKVPLLEKDISYTFSGLRWLPVEDGYNISQTSRSHILGEIPCRRGLLLTIYGGKLTTYRTLSASIGDRILKHFGEFQPSKTGSKENWVLGGSQPPSFVDHRFQNYKSSKA